MSYEYRYNPYSGYYVPSGYADPYYRSAYTAMYQCILNYGDKGLSHLTEQDKASLGLIEQHSIQVEYNLNYVDKHATWRSVQPTNVDARNWVLERLRRVKPFASRGLFIDPQNRYVWFWVNPSDVEAVLEAASDPPEPNPVETGGEKVPAPVPWFKTPNGKRYLDEWRNGRLQKGTYVFEDAGKTVRCIDSAKPLTGDPIAGDVMFYVYGACAFIVDVDPGILLAPSGIGDVVP